MSDNCAVLVGADRVRVSRMSTAGAMSDNRAVLVGADRVRVSRMSKEAR
ncbi:hypothetical protein [Nocardia paucivorans]|nr:hypothetical protein [Nocardia paucivorans]